MPPVTNLDNVHAELLPIDSQPLHNQLLPTVANYNLRSLFPKIINFKTDMRERKIDIAFLSEIWETVGDCQQGVELQKMCELDGLDYGSCPRHTRGGGAAIVVSTMNFSVDKLNITTPPNLDVVWAIVKPRKQSDRGICKSFIVCSFYSPPFRGKNAKMTDHLITTLQMLSTQHPHSGTIMGADRNNMDIKVIECGLKLQQVVDKPTRLNSIHDIIIMNLSMFYKSPIICPPITPDDPNTGKPSDHSVPVCAPHTDPHSRPVRNYRTVTYRPLPDSKVRHFGQWFTVEKWDILDQGNLKPSEQVDILQENSRSSSPPNGNCK